MKNTGINLQGKSDAQQKKIRDMYIEIIQKLFISDSYGKQRCIYNRKVERVGHKKFGMRRQNFVHAALNDLKAHFQLVHLDAKGRILNPKQMGKYFNALFRIVSNNVDLFVIYDRSQLDSNHLPLSPSFKEVFGKIVDKGEAAAVLLVKHPPEETGREIHKITEKSLHGVMSLWADEKFQRTSDIRDGLKDYLHHATVRVISTGYDPEINAMIKGINEHLERHGGFEDTHWIRVVKGVSQDEKKESLKQALGVCVPIIVAIKIVEHVMPTILHAVGGMLDDLFGAIIPDVSQSIGDKELPRGERYKQAWPVLKGGLVTLPVAFALGWFSAKLHAMSDSVILHMLAGVIFAFACCAGTLGTSFGAIKKAYASIEKLQKDKKHGYLVADYGFFDKVKLAFKEAIMDVPFRVGHTVIGVPFQILLGMAAGAFGFFHNSIFIMVEGMAETLLGSAAAFAYPWIARLRRNSRLRRPRGAGSL
jgi:hypothetical protein